MADFNILAPFELRGVSLFHSYAGLPTAREAFLAGNIRFLRDLMGTRLRISEFW